jgi:hypothetical protein
MNQITTIYLALINHRPRPTELSSSDVLAGDLFYLRSEIFHKGGGSRP